VKALQSAGLNTSAGPSGSFESRTAGDQTAGWITWFEMNRA